MTEPEVGWSYIQYFIKASNSMLPISISLGTEIIQE